MEHRDAVALLGPAPMGRGPQRWADVGCGTGTFTRALAERLPRGSTIAALDRDALALMHVPDAFGGVHITKQVLDVVAERFPETELDGILLANVLHFVRDQAAFIRRIGTGLAPSGSVLVVEYDTDIPNPWVPHPRTFAHWSEPFSAGGFPVLTRLGDRPSAFGRARLIAFKAERAGEK